MRTLRHCMTDLGSVRTLVDAGRYLDAIEMLNSVPTRRQDKSSVEVLRAELLERTGMYAQAADLAGRLLRSSHIVGSQRSACECVIGLVQWDAGDLNSGISHFQRAVVQAEAAKEIGRAHV